MVMNKEKTIQKLNYSKQLINEGSKSLRDWIDNYVTPLVKGDPVVHGLVQDARRIFTTGDQGAKRKIDEAIQWIQEGPIPTPGDERLGYGGTQLLWFTSKAWGNLTGAKAMARETLQGFADLNFGVGKGFGWLSSLPTEHPEHNHLRNYTPWKKEGNVFQLDQYEQRYFEILEEWLDLHKSIGTEFEYCLAMSGDYSEYPFTHNLNGVTGLRTFDGMLYIRRLARRVCQSYQNVYGSGYRPRIKILNEPRHWSFNSWHELGNFHKAVAEILLEYTTIDKIKLDLTVSEAPQIYLNEPLPCGKCGQLHGDERFDRSDPTNSVLCELHSIAHVKNLKEWEAYWKHSNGERNPLKWHGSKWKRYEISGDGGAHFPTNGFRIPGTGYWQGNYQETYDLHKYYFGECKKKGKRGYVCLWLGEIYTQKEVGNNNWVEDWKASVIDWDRPQAVLKALNDVES